MTFTYDATDLSTDLAKVRLAIGDVVDFTADAESLTDEEIAVALAETSSLGLASVRAMEDLIAKMTRAVARGGGGVSSDQSRKFDQMNKHLGTLRRRAGKGRMTCYAGGISKDRVEDTNDDEDFRKPAFRVGMDDYPTPYDGNDEDV